MTKALLAFAALASALPVSAQTLESLFVSAQAFESRAAAAIETGAPQDAFAGVAECAVLDRRTVQPYSLEEARGLLAPCLAAVGRGYQARLEAAAGFLSDAGGGAPLRAGLLVKTDLAPGSKALLDLKRGLSLRGGRLLGHRAAILSRKESAPAPVSAVQRALDRCVLPAVVRDLRDGTDFVKIYGGCLKRDEDLKITELRAGEGLSVLVVAEDGASAELLAGYVTADAGGGPVTLMVLVDESQNSR